MFRIKKTALLVLGFISFSSWSSSLGAKPPYIVMPYLAEWGSVTAAQVPWADINYIAEAFGLPQANGATPIFSNGQIANLVSTAHSNGTRCVLSIGGASASLANWSSSTNSTYLPTFIANIMSLVGSDGYDGIDIDWEFPNHANGTPSDTAQFTALMQGLYDALHNSANPNYQGTAYDGSAKSLSFYITPGYDDCGVQWPLVGAACDFAVLPGYDQCPDGVTQGPIGGTYANTDCAGNSYNLSVSSNMARFSGAGFPKAKFVLGMPFSNCGGATISSVTASGSHSSWNATTMESLWSSGATVNDATAFCAKINWALGQGFKGISMWELNQAYPVNGTTEVQAIWNTIAGNVCVNVASPTPSATRSVTATRSPTPSATRSATATRSPTPSATLSPSPSVTPSPTVTATPNSSATPSATVTASPCPTASASPSRTLTATPTASPTASPTSSPSGTATPGATLTVSSCPTASASPSRTATATASPLPSPTSSPSGTLTVSPCPTTSASPSGTLTVSPCPTTSASPSGTLTVSPCPTASASPSRTATAIPTASPTATASATPTPSLTPTARPLDSATPTPCPTASPSPTSGPTLTASQTASPSPAWSATGTPAPGGGGDPLGLAHAWAVPDPVQGSWLTLRLRHLGSDDRVTLRLYTEALVRIATAEGVGAAGPVVVPGQMRLPAGLARGVYYLQLRVWRGSRQSPPYLLHFYYQGP